MMGVTDPNPIEAFFVDVPDAPVPASGEQAGRAPGGDDPVVIVEGDAGALSHTLLVPLTVNGEPLRRVTMRLAELGDIDDWGGGRLTNRDLLCRLTGLHPAVLRRLKWPDAEAVIKLFEAAVPDFVMTQIEQGGT